MRRSLGFGRDRDSFLLISLLLGVFLLPFGARDLHRGKVTF